MADPNRTTVVETRSGGSGVAISIAIFALIAVLFLGYMFIGNQNKQTDAVTSAAQSVGQAADKVGDAASGGTKGN